MKRIFKIAIKQTSPVFFGYMFAGMAFGLMLEKAGYSFWWALFISCIIYTGSMQFVLVSFLSTVVSLPTVIITTFAVNSRYMFYGLSFIEKFKAMGKKRLYMIFSITDETYSILCSLKVPKTIDEKQLSFIISALDQCYWVTGSVLGAVIGSLITFNTAGIEFAMTALFVVTFVEQWIEMKSHFPAVVGIICASISLFIFGSASFMLPALICSVILLMIRNNLDEINKKEVEENA